MTQISCFNALHLQDQQQYVLFLIFVPDLTFCVLENSQLYENCIGDYVLKLYSLIQVNADHREELPISNRDRRTSSHSAPLFPEKKSDLADRLTRQITPPTNAYILPTPVDSKSSSIFTKPVTQTNHSAHLWHSSPLEPIKTAHKDAENNLYSRLPRPSEHAFSGPLKPSSTRLPVPAQAHSSSPRISPTASPPLASSPRINELHELPRPPGQSAPPRRSKSPGLVGHSAPLTAWNQERSNVVAQTNIVASPLPIPPLVVSRSFSIPSRNQRAMAQRPLPERLVASPPPLPPTPASLMNLRSLSRSKVGEVAQSGLIRGNVNKSNLLFCNLSS